MASIDIARLHQAPLPVKNKPAPPPKQQVAAQEVDHSKAKTATPSTVTQEGVLSYSDLYSMADNLSAVMAQFKRSTEAEKNKSKSTDPYERILEEESETKIDKFQIITKSPEFTKENFLNFARSMFPDDNDQKQQDKFWMLSRAG